MKSNQKSTLSVLFILVVFPSVLFAQIDTVSFNKYYFKKYWTDSKAIVTAPFHWNQKDWIKFGVITSSVAATVLVDRPVAEFSQKYRSTELDHFSANFLEPFDVKYSFLLMGGFMAHGLLAKNTKSTSTGLLLLESYSLAMIFVRIPKNLIGRKRPDAWPPSTPFNWDGPFRGVSFPSGHTTASFAIASVIANQYRDHKWVPITAYSVATLAGLSRIYENRHWLSDVIAGAAIGTLVGNLVSHRTSNSKLSLTPFGNGNFQGVRLAYTLK
jgi:membrane-associated phospholipid phosphatase